MTEYIFTYRCRYCGKKFGSAITGNEGLASKFLFQTVCNLEEDAQHPGEKSLHYAEDHIGLSELIGCEIRRND